MNYSCVSQGGNVVRDPELKQAGEIAVVNFTIATNYTKKSGEKVVSWIPCVVFGKQAEFFAKNFHKGKGIFVEGRLQSSSWEKDGVKRTKVEIVVGKIEFTDKGDKVDGEDENERSQEQF